jgi:cytidine deaminase
LSASDRPGEPTWPEVERRKGERRATDEERGEGAATPTAPREFDRRRSGADRRDESAWAAVPLGGGASGLPAPDTLIAAATTAREFAHARYSQFKVGAALETVDGQEITGCNIENATYGLTLCAERVALVKALSDGHTVFTRIAVVADTAALTPPCGPCRQLLWEYCGEIDVVLANLSGHSATHRLSALLPLPFDARLLR